MNWLGRNPIPDGTTIRTGAARLDPSGVFVFDQRGCRSGSRPCVNVSWQEENFRPCYVGVRQVGTGTEDEPVTLVLDVSAECESQADCDSLEGDQQGSQIDFVPDSSVNPSGSPEESPHESPSESPGESPTGSPSGSPGG